MSYLNCELDNVAREEKRHRSMTSNVAEGDYIRNPNNTTTLETESFNIKTMLQYWQTKSFRQAKRVSLCHGTKSGMV
ncbi:unnamed protein product [Linum trigynum]|uniref:Uncharacterized protein n=1 Tax=Linum trigynum TaxID=586398 RepID=A0AAV2E869_9ROSI